jgi:lactoylglutathione lyase
VPSHRTVFNHVGLCVADREKSLKFYTELLGFTFWRDLELPDAGTKQLLQLDGPIGVRATYLLSGDFVLELIDYSKRDVHTGSERVMDQVGLTHMSLSVSDLAGVLAQVEAYGGTVVGETVTEHFAMIRDPDGQLIELLPDSWVASLPPRP